MVPTEASDEVRESASAPRGRGSRPEPSRDAQGASSSERPSTPSPAMEPEEVLSHFGVEEAKGLSWGQVKQTRVEDKHDNRIPPPIDCPAWICCLLPCILRVPKMLYFNQIAAEDADVIREVTRFRGSPSLRRARRGVARARARASCVHAHAGAMGPRRR